MAAPRRSAKAEAEAESAPEPAVEPEPSAAEKAEEQDTTKAGDSGLTAMERAYMDALQRERAGYEQRGLKDRMAQVDAELKRYQR
jgi:hypothetical protein